MEFDRYRGDRGVWMIYDRNPQGDIHLIAIHQTPIPAIENVRDLGKGSIGFLPIGMELHKAVEKWEQADE